MRREQGTAPIVSDPHSAGTCHCIAARASPEVAGSAPDCRAIDQAADYRYKIGKVATPREHRFIKPQRVRYDGGPELARTCERPKKPRRGTRWRSTRQCSKKRRSSSAAPRSGSSAADVIS